MSDRAYFRQFLSGRDFAGADALAQSMVNFAYALGDRETGDAFLVDPAHAPGELVELVEGDGLRVVGAIATHYHFDHAGGSISGHHVAGLAELVALRGVPVHANASEVSWLCERAGLDEESLVAHASGDVVAVGGLGATLLHTPGHTPGSQCVIFEGRLLSGDTLFLEGCGRTDLAGSDPREMCETLLTRLASVPDDVEVCPGHAYDPRGTAPMGDVRAGNWVLSPQFLDEWRTSLS